MYSELRESRRFPPDEGTLAWIDTEVHEDKRAFRPTIAALVTDEALHGCGMVALAHDRFRDEAECMVQVGDLAPLRSQIRWIKNLNHDVLRIGVRFLE
jgi:hypothetical protein